MNEVSENPCHGYEELTCDAAKQLTCESLNVMAGKWCKVIFLEEVIDTHPKELGDETYVVPMVKPVQEMNTFTIPDGQP